MRLIIVIISTNGAQINIHFETLLTMPMLKVNIIKLILS